VGDEEVAAEEVWADDILDVLPLAPTSPSLQHRTITSPRSKCSHREQDAEKRALTPEAHLSEKLECPLTPPPRERSQRDAATQTESDRACALKAALVDDPAMATPERLPAIAPSSVSYCSAASSDYCAEEVVRQLEEVMLAGAALMRPAATSVLPVAASREQLAKEKVQPELPSREGSAKEAGCRSMDVWWHSLLATPRTDAGSDDGAASLDTTTLPADVTQVSSAAAPLSSSRWCDSLDIETRRIRRILSGRTAGATGCAEIEDEDSDDSVWSSA